MALFRELVIYNPDTGVLTWRHRPVSMFSARGRHGDSETYREANAAKWNAANAGNPCFNRENGRGYLHGHISPRAYLAHRMAWAVHYGQWPATTIDHINGDRHDNRLANLRLVTPRQNMMNMRAKCHGQSRHKGVSFHRGNGKWIANIRDNGKRLHLGYFADELDAAAAYNEAATKIHGVYALSASRALP